MKQKYILTEETKRQVAETQEKRLQELSLLPVGERLKMLAHNLNELRKERKAKRHGKINDK